MELIIVGAGGHGLSVGDLALSAGFSLRAFVDAKKAGQKLLGAPVVQELSLIRERISSCAFAIAIGDNATRQEVYKSITNDVPKAQFPVLIHPTASVSKFCDVRQGTVVLAQSSIGPGSSVGEFCILNTGTSLDHNCELGDFASLAPGSKTGGNVKIGRRSAMCIGSFLKNAVSVGDDCVLGGNSFLMVDQPSNTVAYGTPARLIRRRQSQESYLH